MSIPAHNPKGSNALEADLQKFQFGTRSNQKIYMIISR